MNEVVLWARESIDINYLGEEIWNFFNMATFECQETIIKSFQLNNEILLTKISSTLSIILFIGAAH